MNYARILSTGAYLPERAVSNDELAKRVDTSDEWITERTGIKNRHIAADNETTASLATIAAQRALEDGGLDPNDIDLILVGTCTPDRMFPSTACLVQKALGIERNIPAFDLSAACAGFLYGLVVAEQFIQAGTVKNALVIGSEVLSRVVDWSDRRTCVLFGDGAGAVVLQQSDEPGILSRHLHAQGRYEDILYLPNDLAAPQLKEDSPYVRMAGHEVFKLAVTELGNVATETIQHSGTTQEEIDWMIPHQANLRIIKSVAKRLNLPMRKVILTVSEHGNTSSASIPLALDEAIKDGRIQRGQRLLMEAIGGGMTWGSVLLNY